jgi:two-component sensor histidine kinase
LLARHDRHGSFSTRYEASSSSRHVERDGPPVKAPLTKGFGTQLIERGLAAQLDGQVSTFYDPAGFRLSVRFVS